MERENNMSEVIFDTLIYNNIYFEYDLLYQSEFVEYAIVTQEEN
jgi:hypothetical protein